MRIMPKTRKIVGTSALENDQFCTALTPEARDNQMINLAVNLAEQQLRDGTASSQVITHYLKLATKREQAELEKLELEKEMLKAKTESLKISAQTEERINEAIEAMRRYSGEGRNNEQN